MGTRPGHPRLLVLLLAVAGAAAAWTSEVNAVLGESVLLSLDLPPNRTVKEIEWTFSHVNNVKIQVAEFVQDRFERPDPQDQFRDRVEMHNETALRIRNLERGDSGTYEARIKLLHPADVVTQLFVLSVYDPLPEPKIQREQLSLTPQECNLTLRCQLPPGSNATVSWQPDSSPGTPRAQLCGDSQTLCLALPVPASNSTYTCVARNPVQERNVSIHLDTLCQQQGTRVCWRKHVCLVAVGVIALPGIGIGISWLWRRRRRKRRRKSEAGALSPQSSEDPPAELLYSEIHRGNSPEPRQWQDQPKTIYCELQVEV